MEPRINLTKASPDAYKAMLGLEKYLEQSDLEPKLLDLIKLRVSQINGCAYCIDMHWKDLRAAGETEQRLYGLDAWRESPYYTERERAALAWAEAARERVACMVLGAVWAVRRSAVACWDLPKACSIWAWAASAAAFAASSVAALAWAAATA